MNETPQLESKQNSYKQLNPNFETMLKAMVFPFYMRVLPQIKKKKKTSGKTVSMLQIIMVLSDATLIFPTIYQ